MKKQLISLIGCAIALTMNAQTYHYVPVTEASQLVDGGEYILVGDATATDGAIVHFAMSTTIGSNKRARGVEATATEAGNIDASTLPEGIMYLTLEGETDAWYLKNADGKYLRNTEGSNYLTLVDTKEEAVSATITPSETLRPIALNNEDARRYLRMYDIENHQFCFTNAGKSTNPVTRLFVKEEIKPVVMKTFFKIPDLTYISTDIDYIFVNAEDVNAEDSEATDAIVMTANINTNNRLDTVMYDFTADGKIEFDINATKAVMVRFEYTDAGHAIKVGDKYLAMSADGIALTETPTQYFTLDYSSNMFKIQTEVEGSTYTLRCRTSYGTFFAAKGTNGGINIYAEQNMASGLSKVETADEDAPVVWYNIQGIRVVEPTDGIYIAYKATRQRKF